MSLWMIIPGMFTGYNSCSPFLVKNGNEFEDWFSEIMELRYPGDFTRVSPWGADGDQKNDGYLRSKRMLFQVYAPETLQESSSVEIRLLPTMLARYNIGRNILILGYSFDNSVRLGTSA